MSPFTPEQEQEALELFKQGKTTAQVFRHFGASSIGQESEIMQEKKAIESVKTNPKFANQFTNLLGLGDATQVFGDAIARTKAGAAITGTDVNANREFIEAPTAGQLGGAALQTAAAAASPAIAPIGMGASMLAGGALGYAYDIGSDLVAQKSMGETLTPGMGTAVGVVAPPAAKALTGLAAKALAPSYKVLSQSLARNAGKAKEVVEETPNKLKSLASDARFNLSDIDPQTETALKRATTDEVNTYFQQAKNAATDTRKPTPLEIVGSRVEEAHDVVGEAIKKAGQGKRSILSKVETQKVSGNVINDTMSEGIQKMSEKYGIRIAADGSITPLQGRVATLDDVDARLVTEYYAKLNKLGVSPTVRQIDDFVDWAQGQLYKQSKSLSTLDSADKAVIADLKQVTGSLNSRLKTEVGNGYAEVNQRISQLLDMQDELSRALGADARKGGGLVKRLFSPTGGRTREIFEQVRLETGIDLDKEANLARFAMDKVGDVRQKSLLEKLDAGFEDAAEIDLTKPMSLIRFIKGRLAMDDQELANEIIRRSAKSSD
jgi:hypothetical protein